MYPAHFGESCEAEDAHVLLRSWRSQRPGRVLPNRPGYVQRVGVDDLSDRLGRRVERVAFLVCPGDFVSVEMPIMETWPAEVAEECGEELLDVVVIGSERDLSQDVDFGLRQLADTAMKGLSPGINDPMTAVTCIGYLRSILVRLVERAEPPAVRRLPDHDVTVIVRRRGFDEHLEVIRQVGRYVEADAWVAGELLRALAACADAARRSGAHERARSVQELAGSIAEQSARLAGNDRDRARIEALGAEVARDA